eukprot:gene8217-biopygen19620
MRPGGELRRPHKSARRPQKSARRPQKSARRPQKSARRPQKSARPPQTRGPRPAPGGGGGAPDSAALTFSKAAPRIPHISLRGIPLAAARIEKKRRNRQKNRPGIEKMCCDFFHKLAAVEAPPPRGCPGYWRGRGETWPGLLAVFRLGGAGVTRACPVTPVGLPQHPLERPAIFPKGRWAGLKNDLSS